MKWVGGPLADSRKRPHHLPQLPKSIHRSFIQIIHQSAALSRISIIDLTEELTFRMKTNIFSFIFHHSVIPEASGFSKDVCRSMVAMLDFDHSGKLGFEEFQTLITDISRWKSIFKLYDKDASSHLSTFELREALHSAGYNLNNKILNALAHRYSSRDGQIAFDDFIMCAVKLKTMMGEWKGPFNLPQRTLRAKLSISFFSFFADLFKARDVDGTNTATFTMEDWLAKTVYS